MDLLGAPAWTAWILPALLILVWSVAWRQGTRRFRLWFATLSPLGAFVGFVICLFTATPVTELGDEVSVACRETVCAQADSTVIAGEVLGANLLLSIPVGVALFLLTLIVETTLMVRRSEAAARRVDQR